MTGISVRYAGAVDPSSGDAREIRRLLDLTSSEFVPPLHARTSTTSKNFESVEVDDNSGFNEFVAQTLQENCLIAELDGKFAGFMSFLPHFSDALLDEWSPCTYVVTIAADPNMRQLGIGRSLYDAVFNLSPDVASPNIATRTWISNAGHIGLLNKLGFKEVHRINNDRGNDIHTVYFARRVNAA